MVFFLSFLIKLVFESFLVFIIFILLLVDEYFFYFFSSGSFLFLFIKVNRGFVSVDFLNVNELFNCMLYFIRMYFFGFILLYDC